MSLPGVDDLLTENFDAAEVFAFLPGTTYTPGDTTNADASYTSDDPQDLENLTGSFLGVGDAEAIMIVVVG